MSFYVCVGKSGRASESERWGERVNESGVGFGIEI